MNRLIVLRVAILNIFSQGYQSNTNMTIKPSEKINNLYNTFEMHGWRILIS